MTTDLSKPDSAADPEPTPARLPHIRCGCGFEVASGDETENRYAFEEHRCSKVPDIPAPWYSWIFSFWGWVIVATIGVVLIAIFRPEALRWL